MSSYVKEKVIRLPFEATGIASKFENNSDMRDYLEDNFAAFRDGKFQIAPTESFFVDYVIERERDSCDGEYGKIRELYPSEKIRFGELFRIIFPEANLDALRVVEYCWYNCCEAPDYYDITEDDFYKEIV